MPDELRSASQKLASLPEVLTDKARLMPHLSGFTPTCKSGPEAKSNKHAVEVVRKSLMKELQISACFRITKILLIRVQPQGQNSMGYTTNMLFS